MIAFADIYKSAVIHKGGEDAVEAMLPPVSSASELRAMSDADYLSAISRRVFRAGLKHSLVDAKWPAFEQAFNGFDPYYCAMLSDDDLDVLMANKAIIRHLGKIKSVRENAQFVVRESKEHGGFGAFLAAWPVEHTIQLWLYLKKHGKQLGGNSAASFLRMVGRDTFMLTNDVLAVLRAHGVLVQAVPKPPASQRDLFAIQEAFLVWHKESGRPLSHISRIMSFTAF
ncbi:DNA-3-methyladenine glycosylase I [Saccharophagus degradans]|uniref:DNA-3-methyladenine glycosylase I n=1 Tax=Saccharophagus degradans TaxID=86304 RepID=A0AAW7X7N9_9GAMM|nr:DNA-3-methyladenine glycosylase I [Saccharophagus degradans]MDO6422872.1 DNA-3-methyladenine glycosylase I [Saccharophagus degradans]MDO6609293.1 DNA-3-methyladenine glycosylase I [Saccharophagus degradans]